MNLSKDKLSLIIIGLISGIIFNFFIGGVFLSLVIVFLGFLIWRSAEKEDRKFLIYIFISGVAVRIVIYFIYANISILSGRGGWLIGDGWGIYSYAWLYAQKIEGIRDFLAEDINGKVFYDQGLYNFFGGSYDKIVNYVTYGNYGYHGFTMLLGYLFYIFGPMKFSGRLINILLATLSGIFVYYIVKKIFGQKSAKISAILVTFFPSMFIWSLDFLKDPTYILMSIIILWSFVMYWNTKNILYIVLIFITVIIQTTLRKDLWLIGLIPLSLGIFLTPKLSLIKKTMVVTIGIAVIFSLHNRINYVTVRANIEKALQSHIGYVNTGGYVYKMLDDRYYAPTSYHINNITWHEVVKAFLKGWYHFLFEPFIWDMKSKSMLMSFPQMILWYLLLMFAMAGMAFGLRYNWKYTSIIIINIFLISSAIALTSGNIGTLFRHRDSIISFYLMFSAVGITHLLGIIKNNFTNEL